MSDFVRLPRLLAELVISLIVLFASCREPLLFNIFNILLLLKKKGG